MLKVELASGSKRGKIVSISENGQDLRALAARQIGDNEAGCAHVVGDDRREALRQLLIRLTRSIRQYSHFLNDGAMCVVAIDLAEL